MIHRLVGIFCVHTQHLHYVSRTLDRCSEIVFSDCCRSYEDIKYNQSAYSAREILVSFNEDKFKKCCDYLTYLFSNDKKNFPLYKGKSVNKRPTKPKLKYLDRAIERVYTRNLTHREYDDNGNCIIMSCKVDNTLNVDTVYSAGSIDPDDSKLIYIGSTTSTVIFRMHNHYEHKDNSTFNKFVKEKYNRGDYNKLRFTPIVETTDGLLASYIEDSFTSFLNGSIYKVLLNDTIKKTVSPSLVGVCNYYWGGLIKELY